MNTPIKIMILQTRHIESISYLTTELVNAFSGPKYEVTLVYLEAGEPSTADKLANACFFLGLDKLAYKGLRLQAKKTLRLFLASHSFDVVIANMYKPAHLLMQLGDSVRAPVCIGIIHAFGELDRPVRRWMLRWLLDSRWHMVGVSEPVRQYLINAKCGLSSRNTSAINNAVDVKAISHGALDRASARKMIGLPQNGIIFGTVGRCVKGKRHIELVQAFQQFATPYNDVFLVIIGDGELYPELTTYITRQALMNKVFLPGYMPEAMNVVRAMDVFVFPSEHEGFGIALLEAMAAGVPTIVNDIEPLRGIVFGCGDVVNCADQTLVAESMLKAYQMSPDQRHECGLAHYQRAKDFYDTSRFRLDYLSLVEKLLSDA